jgi:hypothetical protein
MIKEIEYGLGKPVHLPCGGVAYFDPDSGISYRCETCFAVVGSIGMPRSCKEEFDKEKMIAILAGKKG